MPYKTMTYEQMIAAARDPDYRGAGQHLRSWSQLDALLIGMADEMERMNAVLSNVKLALGVEVHE